MNNRLKKHLSVAIRTLIRKESRTEAFKIITKSDRSVIGEFLYYYHSDMWNIACMELDRAKGILVKKKIMKQGKNDSFKGFKL